MPKWQLQKSINDDTPLDLMYNLTLIISRNIGEQKYKITSTSGEHIGYTIVYVTVTKPLIVYFH